MHVALILLGLAVTVLAVSALAQRWRMSAPLLLTGVGAALSFVPGVPVLHIEPEIVLLGLLPPLLYAAATGTSLVDLRRDKRQILGLSVFLVLATALVVALVAWRLGTPFAVALALGGVVAPPDAVAATAVARRIGLPRRVVSILEGESLFNDATALVTVRTGLALATATALSTALDFGRAALGGILVGLVAWWVLRWVGTRMRTDTLGTVALSFCVPWLAYVPAEAIHASGVIAVVVCGVLLAHSSATTQTAQARVAQRLNWATIQFLLENAVFLLIGLQTADIIRGLATADGGPVGALVLALAVFAAVILVRPVWILSWAWLRRIRGHGADTISFRESIVASWAGMRGVVTIAAAFLLPLDTPNRSALVFTALVVTVGTLALQGFSLGWLARRLKLHGPDPREDALQVAQLTQAAIHAGADRLTEELRTIEQPVPEQVESVLRAQGKRRANLAWEQLGTTPGVAPPTALYRRLRLAMLESERAKVLRIRDKGVMDHEVLDEVLMGLDIEESMIARSDETDSEAPRRTLLTPEHRRGGCDHLNAETRPVEPSNHESCVLCEQAGQPWVSLRMCLTCGNVACCDSSTGRHATAHFEQTGHPVVRSFEPGEAWRWCYADRLLG